MLKSDRKLSSANQEPYKAKTRHSQNQTQPKPDIAALFLSFGWIHPPPLVPPFLLTQNLSPRHIAGSDIWSWFEIVMTPYGIVGQERVNGETNSSIKPTLICRRYVVSEEDLWSVW